MAPLVERLTDDLEQLLVPPFAFFGHSMGAFVLFEVARELRRRKRSGPSMILVSAARAPQIPDPDEPLHRVSNSELLNRVERWEGIPEALIAHTDLLELMLPTLRADLTLCETYRYVEESPLDCPCSVFGGKDDTKVPRAFLEAWRYQTRGEFKLHIFPGGHFYLHACRNELLSAIEGELQKIPGAG